MILIEKQQQILCSTNSLFQQLLLQLKPPIYLDNEGIDKIYPLHINGSSNITYL